MMILSPDEPHFYTERIIREYLNVGQIVSYGSPAVKQIVSKNFINGCNFIATKM